MFPPWLDRLHEPRNEKRLIYDKKILCWGGIALFLLKLASRRQFNLEGRSRRFLQNLNQLAETDAQEVPYDGTIAYFLKKMPPKELESLPPKMVMRLIRMKALDKYRLYGHFLIAIDGSGMLTFKERHCAQCLKATHNGKSVYFHHVLEAKLVTTSGLALSVATEFIENNDPKATKQDCELKAFRRIVVKLKKTFPQLRICLLLDGLYANGPVFALCKENQWKFIITLKEGSLPDLYREFNTLRDMVKENREYERKKNTRNHYAWINNLSHQNHTLNVLQEVEWKNQQKQIFVWVTNFLVNELTVKKLADQGGRLRWKIENEGFNVQKNGGYNLEHHYCKDNNAIKHFYILLQIAHMLNQLMVHGSLLQQFESMLGSLRNLARRMAEHLRYNDIPEELMDPKHATSFQIRLDSS